MISIHINERALNFLKSLHLFLIGPTNFNPDILSR